MNYRTIMNAELKLDVYAGENCDESKPQWESYCEGDMDGDTGTSDIVLGVSFFPPGTKVTVAIPECPKCTFPRMTHASHKDDGTVVISHEAKCECGFDWLEWELSEYS